MKTTHPQLWAGSPDPRRRQEKGPSRSRLAAIAFFLLTLLPTLVEAGDPILLYKGGSVVPIAEAKWILGDVPVNDINAKLLFNFAYTELGFAPSQVFPRGFNFVANRNSISKIVDLASATGRNVKTEAKIDGSSKGNFDVSVYAAPLKANRQDSRRTGIWYCTRDRVTGVYNYRIVVRDSNDSEAIREFGVFDGAVKETKHKFFDCTFDQGWKTVLRMENKAAYDAVRSSMRKTSSLFNQAKLWLHDAALASTKQVALTKASSKVISDTMDSLWGQIKDELRKVWDKFKKVFLSKLLDILKDWAKNIWCTWTGGLFCEIRLLPNGNSDAVITDALYGSYGGQLAA